MAFSLFRAVPAILFFASLASCTRTLRICNYYAPLVFLSWDIKLNAYLPPDRALAQNGCLMETFLPTWSGALYAGLAPNGRDALDPEWRIYDTKVEFTFDGYDGLDYFDVDLEHGVSVPVMIYAGDAAGGCGVDKLPDCPAALQRVNKDGRIVQCRRLAAEVPEYFRKGCPDMYVTANDGAQGTKVGTSQLEYIDVVIGVKMD
ncbi:hypothetical protein LTR36_004187 [Oleoguttula mirabilis]|uniref:Uncharacterized protein n=1 Tax=Oleoguttula mirabilis TaxID=1507867 RepID=A0AAV9JGX4_9PEZI|nr:hypothetical protein LTR36_004187 [Oleoguttula mirabilis]